RERLTSGGWKELEFGPFLAAVTLHWIRPFAGYQPGVALLKYEPGASVPRPRPEGLENILVLDGVQPDEKGDYISGRY
ncbi:cupin domain-containing protein, partial [Rhizobium leguminosarum]|uniref:cupin domain-containing protein n=1 Tax=Rhizobium leguminosarum TaxID=384 RepID=UPI003F9CB0BD